jgi:hypothetical protein
VVYRIDPQQYGRIGGCRSGQARETLQLPGDVGFGARHLRIRCRASLTEALRIQRFSLHRKQEWGGEGLGRIWIARGRDRRAVPAIRTDLAVSWTSGLTKVEQNKYTP